MLGTCSPTYPLFVYVCRCSIGKERKKSWIPFHHSGYLLRVGKLTFSQSYRLWYLSLRILILDSLLHFSVLFSMTCPCEWWRLERKEHHTTPRITSQFFTYQHNSTHSKLKAYPRTSRILLLAYDGHCCSTSGISLSGAWDETRDVYQFSHLFRIRNNIFLDVVNIRVWNS